MERREEPLRGEEGRSSRDFADRHRLLVDGRAHDAGLIHCDMKPGKSDAADAMARYRFGLRKRPEMALANAVASGLPQRCVASKSEVRHPRDAESGAGPYRS